MRFWISTLADGLLVLLFALIGRLSHGESAGLAGTWHTAWPFLAGAAIGTLIGRAWRQPGSLAGGVSVWAGALVGGMVLRVLGGDTIAVSFVIVAAVTLAIFLFGWRAGRLLVASLRARGRADARADA